MPLLRGRPSGFLRRSLGCGLLLLLAGFPGCGDGGPRNTARPAFPNVVLITVDTFRFDRVGREPSVTPNIDRLASRGTVFERAVTPIGHTFPALATLLTGLHPREHGARGNGLSLPPEATTVAEVLRDAGYATGAFVSYYDVVQGGGMGQGFDVLAEVRPGEDILPATRVNELAIPWLRTPREAPCFLWVHYFEPHSPYRLTPHAETNLQRYAGAYRQGATVEEFYGYNDHQQTLRNEENRRALNVLYDGEVVEADRAVGEVLSALEGLPPGRDSVVVLTADHGQLLGEHELMGHGSLVWEEVLRVPLIVWDSRRSGGRRVVNRVGLIDLFPTLLELVGLPSHEDKPGRSIAAGLDGEPISDTPYFAETSFPPPPATRLAVMVGDRKLQRVGRTWSLYDLASDPGEAKRLAPSLGDRDLQHMLLRFEERGATEVATLAPIDPERRRRLEQLGYLAPAPSAPAEPLPELSTEEARLILRGYGRALEAAQSDGNRVFPVSRLPDSKLRIKAAIFQILPSLEDPEAQQSLAAATAMLAFFQEGVEEAADIDAPGPGARSWRSVVEAEMRSLNDELLQNGFGAVP